MRIQKWEYATIALVNHSGDSVSLDNEDVLTDMESMGDDGWECIGVVGDRPAIALFKRPKP